MIHRSSSTGPGRDLPLRHTHHRHVAANRRRLIAHSKVAAGRHAYGGPRRRHRRSETRDGLTRGERALMAPGRPPDLRPLVFLSERVRLALPAFCCDVLDVFVQEHIELLPEGVFERREDDAAYAARGTNAAEYQSVSEADALARAAHARPSRSVADAADGVNEFDREIRIDLLADPRHARR